MESRNGDFVKSRLGICCSLRVGYIVDAVLNCTYTCIGPEIKPSEHYRNVHKLLNSFISDVGSGSMMIMMMMVMTMHAE